jgi:exoribonuclease II
MSQHEPQTIIPGTIVEFFEAKQIVTGVCSAVKDHRLSILSEQNREINLARSRVIHISTQILDVSLSRDDLLKKLAAVTALRKDLMRQVNVEELWSLLEAEEEGFDIRSLAELVFSELVTDHHVAAAQRVLLHDRLFFQFKDGTFHARSQDKVEQRRIEIDREEEREAQLEQGSQWLLAVWNRKSRPISPQYQAILIENLRGYCLFGQDYAESAFVKELFKRANIPPQPQSAFRLLVRLGVWHENENLYLHEQNITPDFPPEVLAEADRLAQVHVLSNRDGSARRDLTDLHTITIDSALTRDYDDALSIRPLDENLFEVGIHIADAAELVSKGDLVDREAEERTSSIYLPDGRITMLPVSLSENVCSLKAGEDRLALSFLLRMNEAGEVLDHEIVQSVVKVREQLTYEEIDSRVEREPSFKMLHDLAVKWRAQRLARGAIILPLPEIHVYVNPAGMIQLSRYEKETPSQIMVSEWMIAANGLAASYLADRNIPGIFRGQAECKQETDFTQSEHQIFGIYRKRRLFARAELDTEPKVHCSLALNHYTTVTSPIRRYMDLVVQRQIKQALIDGTSLYTEDELRQLITKLGVTQSKIMFIQRKWSRYWILKYMEQEDIQTLNGLVLDHNGRFIHLLLPDFLIEANMPVPEKVQLQKGEMVRVKIERVIPREDLLKIHL